MSARTPLIAANWKMHKTEAQAEEYIQALLPRVAAAEGVEIAVCVPYTDLRAMVDSVRGSRVEVYAQNMHEQDEGAFSAIYVRSSNGQMLAGEGLFVGRGVAGLEGLVDDRRGDALLLELLT